MTKTIWIDLDNSPHVPLFIPIVKELELRSQKVIITARDYAQTIALLKKTNLTFTTIGKHYGKNKLLKLLGLFIRAYQLYRFIKKHKVHASICHGSRSQTICSWFMRIPLFCGLDYEHTESIIFSRLSTKLWIPEGISEEGIKAIGAKKNKLIKYPGYKEELYLKDFVADPDFLDKHNIPRNLILVILRPPATQANYHDEQSEALLMELIKFLKSNPNVYSICLPRTQLQNQQLQQLVSANFFIPLDVVDGMNAAYYSDLVISGGGTMNREAALLGTPVYSIFSGKLGSLDAYMQKTGLIKFIHNINDIGKIEIKKKNSAHKHVINYQLTQFLVNELLSLTKPD